MQVEPRAILVVDASPFSRGLLMLPAAKALRAAFPNTFITVATARGVSELVAACGLADEAVDLGIIRDSQVGLSASLKRLFRLTRGGGQAGHDWVLDFSPRLETQVAAFLSRGARHVTPSRVSQVLDLFLKRKESFVENHAAECESVLRQVGVKGVEPRFVIPVSKEESLRFEKRLTGGRSGGAGPVVVLYSSRAGEPGEWPLERFADLAHRMVNNFAARVVVVDEPSDGRFTGALKAFLPAGAILLASPRAVEMAAAIERASLVITDERGVAKVAADAGAPALEIAASASPYAASGSYRVLRSSSRARVEAEAVYEAACEMIQGSRTAPLIGR